MNLEQRAAAEAAEEKKEGVEKNTPEQPVKVSEAPGTTETSEAQVTPGVKMPEVPVKEGTAK